MMAYGLILTLLFIALIAYVIGRTPEILFKEKPRCSSITPGDLINNRHEYGVNSMEKL